MAVDNRNFVNTFANEGGADVLVEDKRMDELKSATAKTGSQISTSAQYIPLQDTDGNLVKINPSSFEEAVRNVLGTLLANNDKGTTISAVPALSGSGASLDFGSITPANLASVLGASIFGIFTDFDEAIFSGIYKTSNVNSCLNKPAGDIVSAGVLIVQKNDNEIMQILILLEKKGMYVRYFVGSMEKGWKVVIPLEPFA